MVDGHDQPAAGPQHAPQLGQRRSPVLQVVQHQGRDDIIERAVGERERAAQVGHLQVRVVTEPPPGLLDHPGARVEAGQDGAPVAQRREQRAGAAACVEDEIALVVGRVRLSEGVIVVDPGRIGRPGGVFWNGRHRAMLAPGAVRRCSGVEKAILATTAP